MAFAALTLFFSRSYVGKALTACASNPFAARMVGIDVRRMGLVAFALAGVLGGLAGVLGRPDQRACRSTPTCRWRSADSLPPCSAGSPARSARSVGGLGLGVAGQLTAGYLNGSYQTEVALLLMLLIMIARSSTFVHEEAK